MTEPVYMYALTCRGADSMEGLRVHVFVAQARNMYRTPTDAHDALRMYTPGIHNVIGSRIATLGVTRVECWPSTLDPMRTVFDLDDTV